MIELLVVVVIIGILSATVAGVINLPRQRNIAEDAVRISNVEKIGSAMEAFRAGEGRYPIDTNSDSNFSPFDSSSSDFTNNVLRVYLNAWPTMSSGTYRYSTGSSNTRVCVSAPMATSSTSYIKFVDTTSVTSSNCAGKVMTNCTVQCAAYPTGFDNTGCRNLEGVTCL